MSTGIGAVMSAGVPGTGQPGPGTGGQPAGEFVLLSGEALTPADTTGFIEQVAKET